MTLYAKQPCPNDQHLVEGLNCIHCGEYINPIAAARAAVCNCPLPYRAIKPEEHEESCPALTI